MKRTRVRYDRLGVLVLSTALLVPVARGVIGTGAQAGERTRTYTVRPGDTLWEIAARLDVDGGDPRAFVYDLERANGLSGADIRAGQVLTIP